MPRFRRPVAPVHLLRQVAATVLLAFALVLAVRPGPAPGGEPAEATAPVVVAAADLPAGTLLVEDDLTVARLPPGLLPRGATATIGGLTGRVLAAAIREGEAVTDVRLVGAGLTALLPAGQVAAPVRLADLAVAALVRTGDRIDVLATHDDQSSAVVVVANALVLAAGDRRGEPEDPAEGLLLVAVDGATAARLAAVATTSTLTVTLPPP